MRYARVAVTGGSGRLGRYVTAALTPHCDVTVVDVQPPNDASSYCPADITDMKALTRAFAGHDAVVHLAAIPHPLKDPPELIHRVNVLGTVCVLEAAQANGIRRVVLTSSDSATGMCFKRRRLAPLYLPVDEEHPLRPSDPYGLSKQLGEVIGRSYAFEGHMSVVVLRPTFIVFPSHRPQIPVRGADAESNNFWSYVEPEDVAQAFVLALELERSPFEVFFVAAADTLSPTPTLDLLQKQLGVLPEIRDPELFGRHPNASAYDLKRSREILGFRPRSNWRALVPGGTG
jgi:nucleoside-diphosphate-sugar epimerase